MWRIYKVLFKTNWSLVLEYRAEITIWMLYSFQPLVAMAVWLSLGRGGPVGGYRPSDFVSYYLANILIRQFTGAWIIWDLDREIRMGEFSYKLLKPLSPIHHYLVGNLAAKPLRVGIVLPPILLAAFLTPGVRYASDPTTLVIFVATVFGAWLITFLFQYNIGLLSFWITQTLALNDLLLFGLWSLLSGYLIPLDLFPEAVVRLSYYLPFRYMLSLPLETILGRLTLKDMLYGMTLQWVWIALFWALYRLLWWRGLKYYSAVGA